jgi:hypothetical protein
MPSKQFYPMNPPDTKPRPLYLIARDIFKHWPKPYFGAAPYMGAMLHLESILGDHYGADSARSIVSYFLANAATWRGPEARRLKAELRALLSPSATKETRPCS